MAMRLEDYYRETLSNNSTLTYGDGTGTSNWLRSAYPGWMDENDKPKSSKKPKKNMAKLSAIQKASLDEDTITLIEHEILDDDLSISDDDAVMEFLLLKFKGEFAAQLRKEDEEAAAKKEAKV